MLEHKSAEKINLEKLPLRSEKPEKIVRPEGFSEKIPLRREKQRESTQPSEKPGEGSGSVPLPASNIQQLRLAAIDNILAEGLNEVFLKMKPEQQREFKKRGEETATKINQLLSQARFKVSRIINLIKRWLKLIPGVNRFFLEQEAKIKTDKILKIKDKF